MTAPVPVAELQRRLDMMRAQGINTGAMLDQMHREGLLTPAESRSLVGSYHPSERINS